jgi:hypothetical protein
MFSCRYLAGSAFGFSTSNSLEVWWFWSLLPKGLLCICQCQKHVKWTLPHSMVCIVSTFFIFCSWSVAPWCTSLLPRSKFFCINFVQFCLWSICFEYCSELQSHHSAWSKFYKRNQVLCPWVERCGLFSVLICDAVGHVSLNKSFELSMLVSCFALAPIWGGIKLFTWSEFNCHFN